MKNLQKSQIFEVFGAQNLVISIIFSNFVGRLRGGFGHENNPNYSPFKTSENYEQDGKDDPSGDQLHHHPHPRRSRGHDGVKR